MKMLRHQLRAGFSLAEVLIAVAIFAIAVFAILELVNQRPAKKPAKRPARSP